MINNINISYQRLGVKGIKEKGEVEQEEKTTSCFDVCIDHPTGTKPFWLRFVSRF